MALPYGWKTVSYRIISVDVPSSWVVEPWRATCGVDVPTVFTGPEGSESVGCADIATAAEVILGAVPLKGSGTRKETINGLKTDVYMKSDFYHGAHLSGTITRIWVDLPVYGVSVSVAVGTSANFPGGAPGRAEQIVRTIQRIYEAHPCA